MMPICFNVLLIKQEKKCNYKSKVHAYFRDIKRVRKRLKLTKIHIVWSIFWHLYSYKQNKPFILGQCLLIFMLKRYHLPVT